jgi:hypothetical protein
MKKVAAIVSAVVFVAVMVSMVFAAEAKKGTIKGVDSKAGTVVFCAEGTTIDTTLKVDSSVDLGKVKAGDKVDITVEKDIVKEIKAAKKKPAMGC